VEVCHIMWDMCETGGNCGCEWVKWGKKCEFLVKMGENV
jgi:hypothetical protein